MSNMNNKVILLTLLALLVASSAAFADIVKGRVIDAETKEPLPDASVTLTQKFDMGSLVSNMAVFHVATDPKEQGARYTWIFEK